MENQFNNHVKQLIKNKIEKTVMVYNSFSTQKVIWICILSKMLMKSKVTWSALSLHYFQKNQPFFEVILLVILFQAFIRSCKMCAGVLVIYRSLVWSSCWEMMTCGTCCWVFLELLPSCRVCCCFCVQRVLDTFTSNRAKWKKHARVCAKAFSLFPHGHCKLKYAICIYREIIFVQR